MDVGFRDDYKKAEQDLTKKRALIELLYNTIGQIPSPHKEEPKLVFTMGGGVRGIFVNLDAWDMEMSCSYIAEIEMLLMTEAETDKQHYLGDEVVIVYRFLKNTDMEFTVCNFAAKGCKVTFEGESSYKEVKHVECK